MALSNGEFTPWAVYSFKFEEERDIKPMRNGGLLFQLSSLKTRCCKPEDQGTSARRFTGNVAFGEGNEGGNRVNFTQISSL